MKNTENMCRTLKTMGSCDLVFFIIFRTEEWQQVTNYAYPSFRLELNLAVSLALDYSQTRQQTKCSTTVKNGGKILKKVTNFPKQQTFLRLGQDCISHCLAQHCLAQRSLSTLFKHQQISSHVQIETQALSSYGKR